MEGQQINGRKENYLVPETGNDADHGNAHVEPSGRAAGLLKKS
jgi:hypothetical protein